MDEQVFRRSKATWVALLVGAIAALAFFVWAAVPDTVTTVDGQKVAIGPRGSPRPWIMVGVCLLVIVAVVRKLRAIRYGIRITDTGISDSRSRHELPWVYVQELTLEGSESSGYWLKLVLPETAPLPHAAVDLEGVEPGPAAVFSAAHARWTRARAELEREPGPDA